MRVLDHLAAAFNPTFELADAPLELMVEPARVNELLRLSKERTTCRSEFFRKLFNPGLLRASDPRFGIFDSLHNRLKVVENGSDAHLVKGKDVVAVNQHA